MNRTEYNTCISKGMKGKTFTKEERRLEFCTLAKLCSGKVKTREEALRICSLPKEPKSPTKRGAKSRRGIIDIKTMATCIIGKLNSSDPTQANLPPVIAACLGQKVEKAPSRERFIKKCFKENTSGDGFQYDLKEAQRLRSFCIAKWKEQEASL